MNDENPYESPTNFAAGSSFERPPPSLLRILALLLGFVVLSLCFLFAASGIYFTLNPAVLQAGDQPVPASFKSSDYPRLGVWSTVAVAFAAAAVCCVAKAVSDIRRLLG